MSTTLTLNARDDYSRGFPRRMEKTQSRPINIAVTNFCSKLAEDEDRRQTKLKFAVIDRLRNHCLHTPRTSQRCHVMLKIASVVAI